MPPRATRTAFPSNSGHFSSIGALAHGLLRGGGARCHRASMARGVGIMSVSSLGAPNSAYSYLQSLLQQQSTTSNSALDPMQQLLAAFYPSDSTAQSTSAASSSATTSAAAATSGGSSSVSFSPDTMASLISIQGEQWSPDNSGASQAQSLFTQFDANGDGQISKSEFESVFGSNADTSKVDGLFSALDTNGDGSVSESELTSAAQQSHAPHQHHIHGAGAGQG